jgi:transcriptional regulator with XRE-family HTH domain
MPQLDTSFSYIASASCGETQELFAYTPRMETIHARIRQRREALRLTQAQLAEQLGVSYQTIQQWETEPDPSNPKVLSTAPRRSRLTLVAQVLGVTEEWLITGRGPDGASHDPIAKQLMDIYQSLPEHLQEALMQSANAFAVAADPAKRSTANPYPNKKPPKA